MDGMVWTIKDYLNPINIVIVVLGLVTMFGFAVVLSKLRVLQTNIDNDKKKTGGRQRFVKGMNAITTDPDVVQWEDTLRHIQEFNDIQVKYDMFEQFIPIFPLLGILGTVVGLVNALPEFSLDSGNPFEGLATALTTTICGLVVAILLRFFDSVKVSKEVNKMGLYFDSFEQSYQMTKDKLAQESEE